MDFIDAHHHLWDLKACRYPWLEARGEVRFFGDPTPIQKNYLLEDYLSETPNYIPIKSVHIQVGVAPGDEVIETRWLQKTHEKPEALVAFADLSSEQVSTTLESLRAYSRLRGVRQILGRHELEDVKHNSDALIDNPCFFHGLQALEKSNLSFDLQLIPTQHNRVAALMERLPDLKVAVCHAGSPWDQSSEGLASWRKGLTKLAERDNTFAKISGLGMFKPNLGQADIETISHSVIEIFGPERVMFGSNFPVDKLYYALDDWWSTVTALLSQYTQEERQDMLVRTAETFYRI